MYQFRLPWDIKWYDIVVEWLTDHVSAKKDDREFYSHMGGPYCDAPGPPRSRIFTNALVHYYSVVEYRLHMKTVVETEYIRRAVGTGWVCFQLRHINRDGYLEVETWAIMYDEVSALQFKLTFPLRGRP
jgi:hypothetical protein